MLVFVKSSFPKTDENIPKMNRQTPLWLMTINKISGMLKETYNNLIDIGDMVCSNKIKKQDWDKLNKIEISVFGNEPFIWTVLLLTLTAPTGFLIVLQTIGFCSLWIIK